jgi:hypothetical protein
LADARGGAPGTDRFFCALAAVRSPGEISSEAVRWARFSKNYGVGWILQGRLLTTLLCFGCSHAFAYMPGGYVDVRMQDGTVCFTFPDKEFGFFSRKNVYTGYDVSVSIGDGYAAEVWGYSLKQGVVLKKEDCLVYGVLPENAVTIDYDRDAGGTSVAPPLKFNTI